MNGFRGKKREPVGVVKGRKLKITRLDPEGKALGDPVEVTAGGGLLAVPVYDGDDVTIERPAIVNGLVTNDEVLVAMGATGRHDYAAEPGGFQKRLGRCYELAAKAFFDRDRTFRLDGLPNPARLIHGTWSSPETRDEPIDHAWVILSDGSVWEPITKTICALREFHRYTDAQHTAIYTREEAVRQMLRTKHFGPWHE